MILCVCVLRVSEFVLEGMLLCICMCERVCVHLQEITAVLPGERERERDDSQRCLQVPNSLRDSATKYRLHCSAGEL